MISATGWTVQEVDATPWPDLLDLLDYLDNNPPLHVMIRGFLGIKGRTKAPTEPQSVTMDQVLAAINGK